MKLTTMTQVTGAAALGAIEASLIVFGFVAFGARSACVRAGRALPAVRGGLER